MWQYIWWTLKLQDIEVFSTVEQPNMHKCNETVNSIGRNPLFLSRSLMPLGSDLLKKTHKNTNNWKLTTLFSCFIHQSSYRCYVLRVHKPSIQFQPEPYLWPKQLPKYSTNLKVHISSIIIELNIRAYKLKNLKCMAHLIPEWTCYASDWERAKIPRHRFRTQWSLRKQQADSVQQKKLDCTQKIMFLWRWTRNSHLLIGVKHELRLHCKF